MKRSHRRHRNPQGKDKKQDPFFKANTIDKKKDDSFFQKKAEGIKINKAGDKDEKEADTVAAKIIHRKSLSEAIQKKKKGIIQRLTLSTPKEDEKLGTAEQRMEKDKYIQEMPERKASEREEDALQSKPELQREQENEEELQTSRIQRDHEYSEMDLVKTDFSDKEKKDSQVAKQSEATEEEVDKKPAEMEKEELRTKSEIPKEEKEGAVQAKEFQKQEEKKEGEESIQRKSEEDNEYTDAQVTRALKQSKGKGRPISAVLRSDMEAHFKCSFKRVRIHTDQNAVWMCKQLKAQAFTNGYDIYFNEGKFAPDTSKGKHLLIHELTHVVQQMFRSS